MTFNLLQEDKGLVKIHAVCTQMDAIWRPTPCHDLGIDGQIEFLEPKTAYSTGYILAIQSKSGPSYFEHEDKDTVKYYPDRKHRDYWKRLAFPVVLVLHDPERDLTVYSRVKNQLAGDGPILLRKSDVFCPSARDDLIGIAKQDTRSMPPARILEGLKAVTLFREEGRTITGIEMLLASTNTVSGYFELRMCRIVALFSLVAHPNGVSIGDRDYDFIQRNVMKVHAHNLTAPFLEEFEHMWYDLAMVPDIAVPLSPFGMDVLGHLWSNLETYISEGAFAHLNVQDATTLSKMISDEAQRESDHLDSSDCLGEVPKQEGKLPNLSFHRIRYAPR
jgi:hypothetical protein